MTKRPSLTYTPLNVKGFRHHGPSDPDDATTMLSLDLSPARVVTGRGGETTTTTARKRKKGYAKTVSERKELRRGRRSRSKSRRKREDGVAPEEDDDVKENMGKTSNARRSARSDSDDDEISSPEKEFNIENEKEDEDVMEVDSDAIQGLDEEDADFGGTTEFQVDVENNDGDEDDIAMCESEEGSDDDSALVQKRLFPSTIKKPSSKKRRVIQEEEEEVVEEEVEVDTSQESSNMDDTSNKRRVSGKSLGDNTNNSISKNKSNLDEEDSSDDESKESTPSKPEGVAAGESKRRSMRLEKAKEPSFAMIRNEGNVDEDSENEFTVASASTCRKKKKLSSSTSTKQEGQKVSSSKKDSSAKDATSTGRKKSSLNDDSSDDGEGIEKTSTISAGKKNILSSSTANRGGHNKVSKSKTAKNGNDEAEDAAAKRKSIKDVSSKSARAKKTSSGNSFVQRARAEFEASEALATKCAKATKRSREKRAEKEKVSTKTLKQCDEFDFEEEDFDEEDTGDEDASEYQPTQCEGKKTKAVERTRSPRPSRRSSLRTNKGKGRNKTDDTQPSVDDQACGTAKVIVPRRRENASKGSRGIELDEKEMSFPSEIAKKVKSRKVNDGSKKQAEKKKGSMNNRSKKDNASSTNNAKTEMKEKTEKTEKADGLDEVNSKTICLDTTSNKVKSPNVNDAKTEEETMTNWEEDIFGDAEAHENGSDAWNASGLEVEYHEAEEDYDNATSMLLTQAAASQFMQQSWGSSTAGAEGENQSVKDTLGIVEDEIKQSSDGMKLKSIEMDTRDVSRMQVASQNMEQSISISNAKVDRRSATESKKVESSEKLKSSNPSGHSSKAAENEVHDKSNNGFTSSIELTTRAISKMDPNAIWAALQTQQVCDPSQQSSAVSPETKESMVVDSGNEKTSQNKQHIGLSDKMSPEEVAREMKKIEHHLKEASNSWNRLSSNFSSICNA